MRKTYISQRCVSFGRTLQSFRSTRKFEYIPRILSDADPSSNLSSLGRLFVQLDCQEWGLRESDGSS